jgi:hypothetical protein
VLAYAWGAGDTLPPAIPRLLPFSFNNNRLGVFWSAIPTPYPGILTQACALFRSKMLKNYVFINLVITFLAIDMRVIHYGYERCVD